MAIITFNDIHGVKQTLDTEQKFNVAFNADCMEFLRACPDKCFELSVVDPPFGDATQEEDIEHRNQRGRFDRYNESSQTVNVEREREAPQRTTALAVREADSRNTKQASSQIPRWRKERPLEKVPHRRRRR